MKRPWQVWCGIAGLICMWWAISAQGDQATHRLPDQTRQRQVWQGDALSPYIQSGCAPAVPGGLTLAAFACEGYVRDSTTNELLYVGQPSAAVGPLNSGNGTYWLAIHRDRTTTVAGWTRQGGAHYLWQLNATQPADPAGGLVFAQITVAGGVITAVDEGIGNPAPYDGAVRICSRFPGATMGAKLQACIANLPVRGGTADARDITGGQTIGVDIFSGVTYPVVLLLGAGTFTVSVQQTWPITGGTRIYGTSRVATVLRSSAAVPLFSHASSGGNVETYGEIAHLALSGNNVGTIGLLLQKVATFKVYDVDISQFTVAGIQNRGGLIFLVDRAKIFNNPFGIDSNWFDASTPANLIKISNSRFINNTTYAINAIQGGMLILDNVNVETNGTAAVATTGGVNVDGACVTGEGTGVVIKNSWFESNKGHSAIRFKKPTFVTCLHVVENTHSLGGGVDYGLHVQGTGAETIDFVASGVTMSNAAIAGFFTDATCRRCSIYHSLGSTSLGATTSTWPNPAGTPDLNEVTARAGTVTFEATKLRSKSAAGDLMVLDPVNQRLGLGLLGVEDTFLTRSVPGIFKVQGGIGIAQLIAADNGSFAYCVNCTRANPCAGGGPGAWAFRDGGVWRCDAIP